MKRKQTEERLARLLDIAELRDDPEAMKRSPLLPEIEERLLCGIDDWHVQTHKTIDAINQELFKLKFPSETWLENEIDFYDRLTVQHLGYAPISDRAFGSTTLRRMGGDKWQLALKVIQREDGKLAGYAPLCDTDPEAASAAFRYLPFLFSKLAGRNEHLREIRLQHGMRSEFVPR